MRTDGWTDARKERHDATDSRFKQIYESGA